MLVAVDVTVPTDNVLLLFVTVQCWIVKEFHFMAANGHRPRQNGSIGSIETFYIEIADWQRFNFFISIAISWFKNGSLCYHCS